eukprot:249866_1
MIISIIRVFVLGCLKFGSNSDEYLQYYNMYIQQNIEAAIFALFISGITFWTFTMYFQNDEECQLYWSIDGVLDTILLVILFLVVIFVIISIQPYCNLSVSICFVFVIYIFSM